MSRLHLLEPPRSRTPRRQPAPSGKNRVAAAIDLGTQSVRAMIGESFSTPQGYRVLEDIRIPTRLGKNLPSTGRIEPGAEERLMAALRIVLETIRCYHPDVMGLVATSALREAANGGEIASRIGERFGISPRILTGEEEAAIAFGAFSPGGSPPHAMIDIGGGSIQVVLNDPKGALRSISKPLGSVYLTDRFVRSDPLSPMDMKKIREAVRDGFFNVLGKPLNRGEMIVGTGGTFTTLAAVIAAEGGRPESIHGMEIPAEKLRRIALTLARTPLADLRKRKEIPEDRAYAVPAGALAAAELVSILRPACIRIHATGLREGFLIQLLTPPACPGEGKE